MNTGTTQTVADWALNYLDRGWPPIPIPFRSKIPKGNEWQNARYKREELPKVFGGQKNIGILLGAPSDNLVDIDLDHQLAGELAPEFLPATGSTFGRAGNPRSHWLYLPTRPAATKKFQFPKSGNKPETDGKMIVEFRSTGCQTVFPGSTHESGEPIEWASDGDPAEVDADELLDRIDQLQREVRRRLGYSADDIACKPLNGSAHNGARSRTRWSGVESIWRRWTPRSVGAAVTMPPTTLLASAGGSDYRTPTPGPRCLSTTTRRPGRRGRKRNSATS